MKTLTASDYLEKYYDSVYEDILELNHITVDELFNAMEGYASQQHIKITHQMVENLLNTHIEATTRCGEHWGADIHGIGDAANAIINLLKKNL